MKKKEFIARYSEAAYTKTLEQSRKWEKEHPDEVAALSENWRRNHPDQAAASSAASSAEQSRKGGKYYDKMLLSKRVGLSGERHRVRGRDANKWRKYKNIIAPNSHLHHQWKFDSAEYVGVALVEADKHMHGIVDVIEILEGNITIFTEKEVREGNKTLK